MKAVTLWSAVAAAGSIALSTLAGATPGLAAEPSPYLPGGTAEAQGVVVAAELAAERGVEFGTCAPGTGLPGTVRCGTVTVPLDYTNPYGDTIDLTVSRVPATGKPTQRQGALLYNPGGPGSSGLFFPRVALLKDSPWSGAAKAYDFVGFDPRGVGRSAPVSCVDPKEYGKGPSPDATPRNEADKQAHVARAKAYAQGCAKRSGRMLPHLTTPNTARDLDVIRAALGEKRLTYMGGSYGTYLGAVYATLFPRHVRRMVLDSVVNPDPARIWYQANHEQSAAFEGRWADWRAWVARHDATYKLGDTKEQVGRAYAKVRGTLAHRPAGGVVGPGELHSAFLSAGYYDQTWPALAKALSAYVRGDEKPLLEQAAPDPDPTEAAEAENGNAVYTAVECADAPWPGDWRTWDRDTTWLARTAPFEAWDNTWMNLPCAFWTGPRQQPLDVRADPAELAPVLLVAAEQDAATPYAGAVELHRRLPGSALVTEKDAGSHGVAYGANACVNERVDAYLLRGEAATKACPPRPRPKP